MTNTPTSNEFYATIKSSKNTENLHLVEFNFETMVLCMISLDVPNIRIGASVSLHINASHIGIAKETDELKGMLSCENQIRSKIVNIDKGDLLCLVTLQVGAHFMDSLITKRIANKLNLEVNDNVIALIPESELSIKEIL